MTRNKAEEFIRKVETLTISDLISLPPHELFSYEQTLQEIADTHRSTKLARKAENIVLVINGRY